MTSAVLEKAPGGWVEDPALLSGLCIVAEPSRTVLPNTSPTGGTNAVSLSQPSACLSVLPSRLPHLTPFPQGSLTKHSTSSQMLISSATCTCASFAPLSGEAGEGKACVCGCQFLLLVRFKNVAVPGQ